MQSEYGMAPLFGGAFALFARAVGCLWLRLGCLSRCLLRQAPFPPLLAFLRSCFCVGVEGLLGGLCRWGRLLRWRFTLRGGVGLAFGQLPADLRLEGIEEESHSLGLLLDERVRSWGLCALVGKIEDNG